MDSKGVKGLPKMHHLYPTAKGDTLCPLGFHPQVRWPTRCKRCFRDYKEHIGKKGTLKDTTASSPSLSPWEPATSRSTENTDKRTWASTSNLSKDESKLYQQGLGEKKQVLSGGWSSTSTIDNLGQKETEAESAETSQAPAAPGQLAGKQRAYTGSQSDSYTFKRFSNSLVADDVAELGTDAPNLPQKLQIKSVKSVVDETDNPASSNTDVEFIIQVKKSRPSENGVKLTESGKDKRSDSSSDKGGKTEKNEIEKLKAQLSEMRTRCEKVEREKSDILLRRLATMDTVSNKSSSNEVTKLQKTVKDLQAKTEALTEEKSGLSTKLRSLEKELNVKTNRSEKDKINEELKSKLKAAETLCETLMDENEDMKKEIRDLEEEIYEMQDNFREEQADEYTTLRKDLEQSNKNCRILSFKLRKVERKVEQLESEKTSISSQFDGLRKLELTLRKVVNEYKNRTAKKTTDYTTKLQLRKMVDDLEKEIADIFGIIITVTEGKDVEVTGIPAVVPQDDSQNLKNQEKLVKECELLKQKLDKATRELNAERDTKKTEKSSKPPSSDDNKSSELLMLKKKLEDAISLNKEERNSWDVERVKLHEEKEKLKSKLLSLSAEKLKVYNEVVQLKKDLESATSSGKESARIEFAMNELKKELYVEKERCKNLQNDLTTCVEKEGRIVKTLASVETSKSQLEGELKRIKLELENERNSCSAKISKTSSEIAELSKELEKVRTESEKIVQGKEGEIATLKKKILSLEKAGVNAKKLNEMKQTYTEKISNLEKEVKTGVKLYDDLNVKYGVLGDSRAHLESQNTILTSKLLDRKHEINRIEGELKAIRETYNKKEDEWVKEKLRMEEKLREYEKSASKSSIDEKNDEVARLRKENSVLTEQLDAVKKANDDLTSRLQDYESVSKIQKNWSADTSALETELRKAKSALSNADKVRKADLAQCKMRYEHRITAINDEIQSIQNQLSRYKRERDTYKHMLEGAQRTIGDLKAVRKRRQSNTSTGKSDEDEEVIANNVTVLEKQISCMEDELSETRLESSKLKTELVSERSAWQVKLSEMQSRVNELEEERLLSSGRTKIPGLKVRMELAWQKEREEQQRLLQETATLARDLRQTLFEIERERDKERLENKRKQDQLKKSFDEEKEENKKKLIELQCDLLELRDAHAKLRTSNEKMRREKERHEREREELRDIIASKRRLEHNEARSVNVILQQVDDLMKLFPELQASKPNNDGSNGKQTSNSDTYTPTPPRRLKGPKSRESSPGMMDSREDIRGSTKDLGGRTEKLEYTIGKLMEVAKELKDTKKTFDDRLAVKVKKFGKRSTSIESDSTSRGTTLTRVGYQDKSNKSSLKRKSVSLEQTAGKNDQQTIWANDSNVSSMQSLDGSDVDSRHFSMQRDSSVDSRLSGGSTKSELLQRDKKYNKGIIRKITTKLTKSASVDDPNSSIDYSMQTSGSEASINDQDTRNGKRNLKKKLTDMFKRGSSRSNSLDRRGASQEASRPSSRNSMSSKN
ncbi:intracellular protein transport protein USO1 isoform X1 [Neodiprion fabricii]|uniref:intracellular protein transport protein USO1 isoform X1 n=1 Tax=Neodiprion fabricii TaxID=2872261 RepID=UPI001ED94E24|nr:intracellular protein transport protein USO1 isoform X1 [Neodiprion fabricii]